MDWSGTCVSAARGAVLRLALGGTGPAVLFLHGIGGRGRQWLAVAGAMRVPACAIVWDARGYGDSTGPGAERFADFAEDLVRVLDALGVARALGVGHSMGGRILIEAALRWPDRFGALFLSGASAAWLPHLTAPEREAYLARRMEMFDGDAVAPGKARAVAREILPPGVGTDVLDALADDFRALRREGYGAALAASAGWDRRADLAALAMPCELLTGARDRICPPAVVEALADAIAPERLTILPGVAHMAQLEAPALVADLVSRFVARNGARASTLSASGLAPA
ncbi:MAG: alpha/beta fold hydrolase [Roseicyclus sp.]